MLQLDATLSCGHGFILTVQMQKLLAKIAARTESGKFFYTRLFAIGLFRLLEITEARDPKALESLVSVRFSLLGFSTCIVRVGVSAPLSFLAYETTCPVRTSRALRPHVVTKLT